MAYHDINCEGLTFSEWIQAAGYFRPDPMYHDSDCAPYTRSYASNGAYFDKWGMRAVCNNKLPVVRRSITYFPKKLRDAWRNGEDPSEYRQEAPKRKTCV